MGLHKVLPDIGKGWHGQGRGRGLPQIGRKRPHGIACLKFYNVVNVCGVEKLRAKERQGILRAGTEHAHARRGCALPFGGRNHVASAVVACGSAADVAKIVGVGVHKLHTEVASVCHRRHADHHWFGAQVKAGKGIGRVTVGRDNHCILIGKNPSSVEQMVERGLVLRRSGVYRILIGNGVVHHGGQAVHIPLRGDVLNRGGIGKAPGLLCGKPVRWNSQRRKQIYGRCQACRPKFRQMLCHVAPYRLEYVCLIAHHNCLPHNTVEINCYSNSCIECVMRGMDKAHPSSYSGS